MSKFFKAEEVFKNLPEKIRAEILKIAEDKVVYFPKNSNKKLVIDHKEVLIKYAQSKKSYRQIGDELGVSKVRIFQIVNQARNRFSKERVEYWKNQGLSLREIVRLFKKSHETIRQIKYLFI